MRGTRTNIVVPVSGTPDAAATTSALALRRAARRSAGSGDPSVAASLRLRSRRLECAIAARRDCRRSDGARIDHEAEPCRRRRPCAAIRDREEIDAMSLHELVAPRISRAPEIGVADRKRLLWRRREHLL